MSVETIVVFSRARTITPVQWQSLIAGIEVGLLIDTDFAPLEFSGFLPCKLFGQDCGFEYHLNELDKDSSVELGPHLEAHWDSVLTLVTRSGLVDCKAAVIAAAAFALGVDGGVVGNEDELLDRSTTIEWALHVLESLKAAEIEARDAAVRREAADAAGPEETLFGALSELTGRHGALLCQMGMLAFVSKPDVRISSSAWRIDIGGKELNSCRYASLREEQISLMSPDGVADRFKEIDDHLDEAGELDEADANDLLQMLPGLGELSVSSARYEEPGQIVFEIGGAQALTARWFGLGTSSLAMSAKGLRWMVGQRGISLA